ncbi:MAG: hypothetical protein ACOYN0_13510 [Phycisphaerales bacterium]
MPTKSKIASLSTVEAMIEEHLAASKRVADRAAKSKAVSLKLLTEAGIVTKSGKRLASRYR